MKLKNGTLIETWDLHPRVAHDLNERGLLWVNEYMYRPYGLEGGGSIDFVAIDPKNGNLSIIECKIKINSLPDLEDQLYKYFHAFYVMEAVKEVYAFDASDEQREWLHSRKIQTRLLSMEDDPAPIRRPSLEEWEYFEMVFDYWHGGWILPYAHKPMRHYPKGKEWHAHEDRMGLVRYYRKWLGLDPVRGY